MNTKFINIVYLATAALVCGGGCSTFSYSNYKYADGRQEITIKKRSLFADVKITKASIDQNGNDVSVTGFNGKINPEAIRAFSEGAVQSFQIMK